MCSINLAPERSYPNSITADPTTMLPILAFTAAKTSCCFVRQARHLDQGLRVIQSMSQMGIIPNTVTFNSLIPLCKDLEQGFEILERMEAAKVERNTVTFTSLFSLAKNVVEGISILEKAKGIFTYLKSDYLYKLLKFLRISDELLLIDNVRVEWEVEVDENYLKKVRVLQSKFIDK